jgi:energy-coupling factor transporter ATP-binding protein EcfA2
MNSLVTEIESLDRRTAKIAAKMEYIDELLGKEKAKLKSLLRSERDHESALLISQKVAQQTQEELEFQVSALVTNALESIFPDPYEFRVEFEIKRGKTEARMFFLRDNKEIDPITASGGGVVEVAAFALRLSAYLISADRPPAVMIMDEPFRFVSASYQQGVVDLLEEMSDKLGIQLILITHVSELVVGNVIQM